MVINSAMGKGVRSSVGKLALPFRPLYNRMSLLSFLLFLGDSHLLPKNASHTPSFILVVPCYKPGRALLDFF